MSAGQFIANFKHIQIGVQTRTVYHTLYDILVKLGLRAFVIDGGEVGNGVTQVKTDHL